MPISAVQIFLYFLFLAPILFLHLALNLVTWVDTGPESKDYDFFQELGNPSPEPDRPTVTLEEWFYCKNLPNLPYEVYQLVVQFFIDRSIISYLHVRRCRYQKFNLPLVAAAIALSSKSMYQLLRSEWNEAFVVSTWSFNWAKDLVRYVDYYSHQL
ncbi:hypothetical protein RhiLY_01264 [Ceratobasidium sp. AG-Ba]|nr:hypothetical protein RhiLY_01264 [Ceratobasidium sp. AG-Ba]